MEINKDIADLESAENRKRMAKKFVLCYHNFNVKNCKRASAEIRKIAAAAGSPITIAVVPSIGGVPESEVEYFCEQIEQFIKDGYEIILHGARHRADLFVPGSVRWLFGCPITEQNLRASASDSPRLSWIVASLFGTLMAWARLLALFLPCGSITSTFVVRLLSISTTTKT